MSSYLGLLLPSVEFQEPQYLLLLEIDMLKCPSIVRLKLLIRSIFSFALLIYSRNNFSWL